MADLAALSFTTPWVLTGLLGLPLLWHILKVTPPKPQTIKFPAVRLLQELKTHQVLATQTPWWIILLRSLIIIGLITALAGPQWNAQHANQQKDRPLIVIVDNDWSVMDRWSARQDEIQQLLESYSKVDQPVLLATSADQDVIAFDSADTQKKKAPLLKPRPWLTDRETALAKIKDTLDKIDRKPRIVYLSNGMKEHENDDFIDQLNQIGNVEIFRNDALQIPIVIKAAKRTSDGFNLRLHHLASDHEKQIVIHLIDDRGTTLYQHTALVAADTVQSSVDMAFPSELRPKAARLQIKGAISPSAQFLLDERWRDRPVGLIDTRGQDKALLSPAYYVRKSLLPYAPIHMGQIEKLLDRDLAILINTDYVKFTDQQTRQIENWMNLGGIFVQFASDKLAERQGNQLSPVQLMQGERTLGGSLSWKRPANMAPFPLHGPFAGLNPSDEIKIKKQVLARPEPNLSEKTWARLKDGTPLITAQRIGNGWSVLFHTTPIPGWSDLPLSGTFEQMMIRLLNLSNSNTLLTPDQTLAPYRLFDHNGALVPPYGASTPATYQTLTDTPPSQKTPPGYYGQKNVLKAFNLGPALEDLHLQGELPIGVSEKSFQPHREIDLSPWAFLVALGLLMLDWVLALSWISARTSGLAAGLAVLLIFNPAYGDTNWDKALAAANDMRLAYMVTGDDALDETSRRGLDGLGVVLRRRTAVELAPTMAFDPEKDDPSLFPMIYWPINEQQQTDLSDIAATKLNKFMRTGGFILFDTMGKKNSPLLSRLSEKLEIADLRPVSNTHVLTRSFYLINSFPGRYDHQDVWVEAHEDSSRDRVSSLLVGANSWAQAWARDDSLRPMYPVVPGGEVQREYAYRFGVNLVMYILSGNYKGDQVHLPAIMQRLGL